MIIMHKEKNCMLLVVGVLLLISLSVQASAQNATKDDVSFMLSKLEKSISDLKEQGLNTIRLDDSLAEMTSQYANGRYDDAAKTYAESTSMINRMVYLTRLINSTGLLLEEAKKRGLETGDAGSQYTAGVGEFRSNNFEAAQISLEKSQSLAVAALKNESKRIVEELKLMSASMNESGMSVPALDKTIEEVLAAERANDMIRLFTAVRDIGLINTSVSQVKALTQGIAELEENGYENSRAKDSLQEMTYFLEASDYSTASQLYNQTMTMIAKIPWLDEELKKTAARLESPELEGIELSEAEDLINLSSSEFLLENYEQAEDYLNQAKVNIEETEQEHIFTSILNKARAKFDIIGFLKRNWLKTIIILALLYAAARAAMFIIRLKLDEKKLDELKKEQLAIVDLTKKLQMDYFKHNVIDKDTFQGESDNYEKRSTTISGEIPLLESSIKEKKEKIYKLKEITINRFGNRWSNKLPQKNMGANNTNVNTDVNTNNNNNNDNNDNNYENKKRD